MQVVEIEAESTISVLFVSDLHLGDTGSYYNNVLQFLRETDDYIVLLGDLIDVGIANSITNVHSQEPNMNNQLAIIINDLKELKERILGYVPGNHEERLNKKAGVKLQDILAISLEIPVSDDFIVFDVTTPANIGSKKRICYRVACTHGIAGGRYPEKNMRQGRWFMEMLQNIDLYVLGHTHQASVFYQDVYVYDDRNKSVQTRQVIIANVGGFVDAEYGRKALFKPSSKLIFRATFFEKERKIQTEFIQI